MQISESDDYLLTNQRIINAIGLNPLTDETNYQIILDQKIDDLETGNTGHWSDYRNREIASWTTEEKLEIYMQKVAFMLYVEKNDLVPWSILDYSDEDLELLVSDLYISSRWYLSTTGNVEFNGNPLNTFNYMQESESYFPEREILTHEDALDVMIMRMREDGWRHFQADAPDCGMFTTGGLSYYDFECLAELRLGADGITSQYLYAVMQSYNVPSKKLGQFLRGHTGIHFTTMSRTMKGNDVYISWRNGFYERPNKLPVEITYLDWETYDMLDQGLVCDAWEFTRRWMKLNYLNLYDDPSWNSDHWRVYCFGAGGMSPGDRLRELLEDSLPGSCQDTDPTADDYWEAPLSDAEIDQWIADFGQQFSC